MRVNYAAWIIYGFVVTSLVACGSNIKRAETKPVDAKEQISSYLLKIAGGETASFSGYLDFDEYQNRTGVSGAIYSGYSGASFLASILTHAVIANSIDQTRMENFIKESDLVLTDYKEVLKTVTTSGLKKSFFVEYTKDTEIKLPLVASVPESNLAKGRVVVSPEFVVSTNEKSILLENEFNIEKIQKTQERRSRRSRSSKPPAVEKKVVVVADSIQSDPKIYWTSNNGANLRTSTSQLFNESIELFWKYGQEKQISRKKRETLKYSIGDILKIERGTVLERNCTRVVFRSLRGWIKSVPIHPDYRDENKACTAYSSKRQDSRV